MTAEALPLTEHKHKAWSGIPGSSAGRWKDISASSSGCGPHPALPCLSGCLLLGFCACSFSFLPQNSRKREALGGAWLPHLPFRRRLRPGCCGARRARSFRHGSGLARLWLRCPGGIRRDHWLCKSR
ncbi:hypothetical protein Nmel_000989 [Mimus melanotis]